MAAQRAGPVYRPSHTGINLDSGDHPHNRTCTTVCGYNTHDTAHSITHTRGHVNACCAMVPFLWVRCWVCRDGELPRTTVVLAGMPVLFIRVMTEPG